MILRVWQKLPARLNRHQQDDKGQVSSIAESLIQNTLF